MRSGTNYECHIFLLLLLLVDGAASIKLRSTCRRRKRKEDEKWEISRSLWHLSHVDMAWHCVNLTRVPHLIFYKLHWHFAMNFDVFIMIEKGKGSSRLLLTSHEFLNTRTPGFHFWLIFKFIPHFPCTFSFLLRIPTFTGSTRTRNFPWRHHTSKLKNPSPL